jgi:hypothetical protein
MRWKKRLAVGSLVAGMAALGAAWVHAQHRAGPQRPPQAVQYTSTASARPLQMTLDFSKGAIERSAESIVAGTTAGRGDGVFVNPTVEAGKVRWHKDFASACAAAAKSGKPVLLFQMMGRLDHRFC